jgi:hypothetical protein
MIKIIIPGINQVKGAKRWFEPPSELPVQVNTFVIGIMLAKKPYPEVIGKIVIQGQNIQQGAVLKPDARIRKRVWLKIQP